MTITRRSLFRAAIAGALLGASRYLPGAQVSASVARSLSTTEARLLVVEAMWHAMLARDRLTTHGAVFTWPPDHSRGEELAEALRVLNEDPRNVWFTHRGTREGLVVRERVRAAFDAEQADAQEHAARLWQHSLPKTKWRTL